MPFEASQPPEPPLADPPRSFPGADSKKGWRREKKLNLIRTINPEFKDLAQTWGWKMITAHEKMYPRPSGGYSSKILYAGFDG
jgi:hypothetical protein